MSQKEFQRVKVIENAVGGRLSVGEAADGAAQLSSNGFLDVNNLPPWDIWVGFSERTLVSWVPRMLVNAAQMAIQEGGRKGTCQGYCGTVFEVSP